MSWTMYKAVEDVLTRNGVVITGQDYEHIGVQLGYYEGNEEVEISGKTIVAIIDAVLKAQK